MANRCWDILYNSNILILWSRFVYILMEQTFFLLVFIYYLDMYLILKNPFKPQRMRYYPYITTVVGFVLATFVTIFAIQFLFYSKVNIRENENFPFIIYDPIRGDDPMSAIGFFYFIINMTVYPLISLATIFLLFLIMVRLMSSKTSQSLKRTICIRQGFNFILLILFYAFRNFSYLGPKFHLIH